MEVCRKFATIFSTRPTADPGPNNDSSMHLPSRYLMISTTDQHYRTISDRQTRETLNDALPVYEHPIQWTANLAVQELTRKKNYSLPNFDQVAMTLA